MLTLLHTAEVHRASFDRLQAALAPDVRLTHVVRPDWLRRARDGIDAGLEAEIAHVLQEAQGPVLCTCTTLGPVAAKYGAVRLDAPMMAEAARLDGEIMLVYTVASTRVPSLALLQEALTGAGRATEVHLLDLSEWWPLFEAGELTAFHASIAAAVREGLRDRPNIGPVVLAQASMAGAADLLADLPQTVLSSPRRALEYMIARG